MDKEVTKEEMRNIFGQFAPKAPRRPIAVAPKCGFLSTKSARKSMKKTLRQASETCEHLRKAARVDPKTLQERFDI